MERGSMTSFDESKLTKGQVRKLTALRKSLGSDIANDAFGKWIEQQSKEIPEDPNVALLTATLMPLIEQGKLRIPRGGYHVRRGRGRVIIERVAE